MTGISWRYSVTANAQQAGTIALWQLINAQITKTAMSGGTTTDPNMTQSCVDNAIPYAPPIALGANGSATYATDDSPGSLLDGSLQCELTRLRHYFMYKPSDDVQGPSIWVALQRLQWTWDAQTTLQGIRITIFPSGTVRLHKPGSRKKTGLTRS